MSKIIQYVICYPDRAPLITLTKTDEDGSYTITKPCESDAVCAAADALFVALCADAKCEMPSAPTVPDSVPPEV